MNGKKKPAFSRQRAVLLPLPSYLLHEPTDSPSDDDAGFAPLGTTKRFSFPVLRFSSVPFNLFSF